MAKAKKNDGSEMKTPIEGKVEASALVAGDQARSAGGKIPRAAKAAASAASAKSAKAKISISVAWDQRPKGAVMSCLDHVPTIAKMSDGSLLRGVLTSERAFALLWSPEGESLAREWLGEMTPKRLRRGILSAGDTSCSMHLIDFAKKRSEILSFNYGFLECSEARLLAGESREAWMAAYQDGARYVDGLGFARCSAPKDWRYEFINPRDAARACMLLSDRMDDRAVSSEDLFHWVKDLKSYAKTVSVSGKSLLSASAETYFQTLERAVCAEAAAPAPPTAEARKIRL